MKKKSFKKILKYYILMSISVLGIFTSCSPEYIPNMVNSPLFSNANEFQATISTGTSIFDAQVAYAVTDNIGIMVNGTYGDETSDSTDDFHKHAFIEGGLGYYNKIGAKGRYEIYGGCGIGTVEGLFENNLFDNDLTDARYNRFFIQPGIGISTGIFDGGFSPRFVMVQMNPHGMNFENGSYKMFFEPVITSKIGFKYVKFVFQVGASLPISGNDDLGFDNQPFIVNLGINLNLGRIYDF